MNSKSRQGLHRFFAPPPCGRKKDKRPGFGAPKYQDDLRPERKTLPIELYDDVFDPESKALTEPEPPSVLCRRLHIQMCHKCDDYTCGDNQNPKRYGK